MDKEVRWNYYKLDSVAKLVSGRTPERDQKEYYAPSGVPWVKIENLDRGYITETAEYLSEKGKEKVNLVPENSILFSIVGTVGKVGIAGRELATNQQIVALVFDESKVLPLYGYYFLRYHADKIRKISNQTTMALISRKTLGQYRIFVPDSLKVQREIVEKLDKFQTYVDKKRQLRRQMDSYEGVLFQKIFQNEIRYHEKLYLREFLMEPIVSGISRQEEPEGDFPCIRSSEFSRSYLSEKIKEQWRAMEPGALCIDSLYQVQRGDILLRNGLLMLMGELDGAVYFEKSILRIRTRQDQLLPEVLYAYLNLPAIRHILYKERKAGDSRKRPIRGSELERLEIPYFTMEKQREFAACLEKIRRIQNSLDKEMEYAKEAFGIACRMLLNGQMPAKEQEKPAEQEIMPEIPAEHPVFEAKTDDAVSHLILAVLCGWSPMDERTGEYCRRRQEIFKRAQPFFQPVALSLVTEQGQREYLLERDFLAYHSAAFCGEEKMPLDCLREMLKQKEQGEILDAHLAFQGEMGICTDADWDRETVKNMAREGLLLLAAYSGLSACGFLFI